MKRYGADEYGKLLEVMKVLVNDGEQGVVMKGDGGGGQ